MKIKGLRWYIITLIAIATVINYIDRSAINILWPYIHEDFGIDVADSKNALAAITTFFMIAYAIGQTVTGKMMDAIGTRLGMTVSILGWSLSIALHAFAKTILSFSIFRLFLGFFEAGNWPGATKNNAEWFPPKERAIAQGIFGAGASLGSVVSAPVIVLLYIAFGWKATFVLIGFLGLIWLIPWLYFNRNIPQNHPFITEEEKQHIMQQDPHAVTAAAEPLHWKELLKIKNTWGIILSRFFIDPVWWLFVTWLPTFLKEQFHFDIKQIGAFAWVPYLFAALGSLAGGYYSSYRIRQHIPAVQARKEAVTIGSILMIVSLIIILLRLDALKDTPTLAMCLIGMTLFGFQFLINNIQTLPSDYFHGKNVGTVSGMGGTAAVLGTLITTWIVPIITQTSYISFFALAAILVPLSWISIKYIYSKK